MAVSRDRSLDKLSASERKQLRAVKKILQDRERQLQFALGSALAVVFDWDIRKNRVHRIYSSTAALPETGENVGTLEEVVQAIHPQDRERFQANIKAALNSPSGDFRSEHRVVNPDGSVRWLSEVGGVDFGADGAPTRLLGVAHDVTERKQSETALLQSEERHRQRAAQLQAILDTAPIGLAIADPGGKHIRGNRANEEMFGLPHGAELSKTAANPAPYRVFQAGRELPPAELPMQRAVHGETVVGQELEVIRADGKSVSIYASAKPLVDEAGEVWCAVGAFLDITPLKTIESALRAHETMRHLVEQSPFGIYVIDADFRLAQVSDGARKVFENVEPLIGRDFAEVAQILWKEPFSTEVMQQVRHTLETGIPYRSSTPVEQRADVNAIEAYDWQIHRLMLSDGRLGVVCYFYDLSERARYEEHIRVLMREITHRSKNILALVQSIATMTSATSPEDFVQRFRERIQSLAGSHDLLVRSEWKSAPLTELIRTQLSPFADMAGTRITAVGPPLSLNPLAAQSIGMALHELATNSVKYGALSSEAGRVALEWRLLAKDSAEPEFSMSWIERGGPLVRAPTRLGFGSKVTSAMIEGNIGGEVSVIYAERGFEWHFKCHASDILEKSSASVIQTPPWPTEK